MYACLCSLSYMCRDQRKDRWRCPIPGPGVTGGGETWGPGTKFRFSGRKASTLTAESSLRFPASSHVAQRALNCLPVLLPPHRCLPLSPVKISFWRFRHNSCRPHRRCSGDRFPSTEETAPLDCASRGRLHAQRLPGTGSAQPSWGPPCARVRNA